MRTHRRRLRSARLLLAGLVLAGACGSAGDDRADPRPDAATTTIAPAGDPAPPASAPSPGDGSDGLPGRATSTSRQEASALPPDGRVASGGPVGSLAPALLRPGNGDRIVVEVRSQAGATPDGDTIAHLVRVLTDASGKAVVVDGPDPIAGSGQDWTARSLTDLADRHAGRPQGGDQVVLRLLFLRGTFEGNPEILGAAVRSDVAAVFADRVDAAAGLFTSPARVEDAVTIHEVGHLLGLVDLVVGAGRGDPEHPGHSRNPRSVMYWAVESSTVGQLLGDDIPTELDADDRAELATIRRG